MKWGGERAGRGSRRSVVLAANPPGGRGSGDRLKVFSDILGSAPFFVTDPSYNDRAVEKRLKKDPVPGLLRDFRAAGN